MPRVVWKGAISLGLVHVPVALYPAAQETGIDFDWLDKRTMDPVGCKRVNKRTGKPIESDHVVKGIRQSDGDYVLLDDEQVKAAYPQTTPTIEIESFVQASEIDFVLLDKPYYLEPIGKGEKVYALLREAMHAAGVIGIARVVMHTKEHLAALSPSGAALVRNTIRWAPPRARRREPALQGARPLRPSRLQRPARSPQDRRHASARDARSGNPPPGRVRPRARDRQGTHLAHAPAAGLLAGGRGRSGQARRQGCRHAREPTPEGVRGWTGGGRQRAAPRAPTAERLRTR